MAKLIKTSTKVFLVALRVVFGGLVLIPLSHLIPKRKSVVFITRFGTGFEGNLKYLYLYLLSLQEPGYEFFFMTSSKDIERELTESGLPVFRYPTLRGVWRLFRTGTIVVDGNEWAKDLKYQILHGARKVQLWHGSGMKTVGLLRTKVKNYNPILKIVTFLLGIHPRYDLLFLNSEIQLRTRGKAFNFKRCIINGQPRNDVLFALDSSPYMNGTDEAAYSRIIDYKSRGYKIVLYAPTYRIPSDEFKRLKNSVVPSELDEYGKAHNTLFVIKYHPKTRTEQEHDVSGASNIIIYDKFKDVYPVFKHVDAMITDYSSIFVDYLLLNRPIVFFPYDYEHYVFTERPLQFDYNAVTPGRKCNTQSEVLEELEAYIMRGDDPYREKRTQVLKNFYDTVDGTSSERIWTAIIDLTRK